MEEQPGDNDDLLRPVEARGRMTRPLWALSVLQLGVSAFHISLKGLIGAAFVR